VAGVGRQKVEILLLGELIGQNEDSLTGRTGPDLRPFRYRNAAAALAASVSAHGSSVFLLHSRSAETCGIFCFLSDIAQRAAHSSSA